MVQSSDKRSPRQIATDASQHRDPFVDFEKVDQRLNGAGSGMSLSVSGKDHPGQDGPVAIWLLAPIPKSVAGSALIATNYGALADAWTAETAPLAASDRCAAQYVRR